MDAWIRHWNNHPDHEQTLHVRWLLNPGQAPRRNVQLTVDGGMLIDIRELSDTRAAQALPLALVPPLVNAHTHLEFSALPCPLQPTAPFTDWIREVIRYRSTITDPALVARNLRRGIEECRAAGVAAVGEIATSDVLPACDGHGPAIVSFRECLALSAEQIELQLQQVTRHLAAAAHAGIAPGISPHAPYSVHPELFHALIELARQRQVPVAMHLAETLDELQLLQHGTGRFQELLAGRNLWNPRLFPGGRSVLEFLSGLATLPQALVIHGNYLNLSELEFIATHQQLTVVYCPRTHASFGHQPHPWRQLRDAGARVALGTDSRASNPDLSIWKELQLVARSAPELAIQQLLPMITTTPAAALHLDPQRYTISAGQEFAGVLLQCSNAVSASADSWARHPSSQPVAVAERQQLQAVANHSPADS